MGAHWFDDRPNRRWIKEFIEWEPTRSNTLIDKDAPEVMVMMMMMTKVIYEIT